MQNRIFSFDSAKAIKANAFGYLNGIHYMAPASTSGFNLCPWSTASCRALCLGWFSGQAAMVADAAGLSAQGNAVRQSRIDKATRFMRDRRAYMSDVVKSIELAQRKAKKEKLMLCIRLNGSTDIAWEGVAVERAGVPFRNIFEAFPEVSFVDYTKGAKRLYRDLPENYHLTLSYTGENEAECIKALAAGHNVAVCFDALPARFWGFPVIDGDKSDLRHLDPKGVVVGLLPKGRLAKKDDSGFVVRRVANLAPLAA
jgi:hypothetical protein